MLSWVIVAVQSVLEALAQSVASDDFDSELRVSSAALLGYALLIYEATQKSDPDVRSVLGDLFLKLVKPLFLAITNAFTQQSFGRIVARVVEVDLLRQDAEGQIGLGCGSANVLHLLSSCQPKVVAE